MADMRYRCNGTLIVVVHTSEPPSDDEWSRYAREVEELLSRSAPEEVRTVVFTDGGGPNPAQRRRLAEIEGWSAVRVSVVSSSAAARAIVNAFSWFNPRMKAFLPVAVGAALRHLGLAPDEESRVWRTLEEFREFGMGHLRCVSSAWANRAQQP